MAQMQKVVIDIKMNDEKTKQKALQAVASADGVVTFKADLENQTLVFTGKKMDIVAIAKKLKKIGTINIASVGPATEEKKEEKKEDNEDQHTYEYQYRPSSTSN